MRGASDWMDGILSDLAELAGTNLPAPALASLIASLIDEWTEKQRPLALAWREAQAAGAGCDARARWTTLWRKFWIELCTQLRLGDRAELLACYFDGEAGQHLVRWRRPLDRALLDETTRALFEFLLHGDTSPSSIVRDAYQQSAEEAYRPSSTAPLAQGMILDEAAASQLADTGLAGLTFRAVAIRAGSTLGTVAYHFGSKAEMAQRALRRLYESSAGQSVADLVAALPATPAAMLDEVIDSIVARREPVLRALDEITLHLSRGDDHGAFSAVIRGFRDPIGIAVLGRMLERETPASSLAAAFSSIVRGFDHQCAAQPEIDARMSGRHILGVFESNRSGPPG